MKFLHTCLRVGNLDRSIDFYKNALGFEISRKKDFPEDKFTLCFLKLANSSYELELTYNYGVSSYEKGEAYGHIALSCQDFEKTYERLKNDGYKVTDLYKLSDNSDEFFFITDPDGYDIEIIKAK